MDTGYNNSDLRIKDAPYSLKDMYNDYAPKLLGYILPVVNNRNLAEDCVVKIFTRISTSNIQLSASAGISNWNRLMALANSEIERMGEAGNECKSVVNNTAYMQSHKHLNRMNDMQREVFCGIYYHRKNTAQLANEISLPEDKVRRILKEAFIIIREAKDEN